MIRPLLVPFLAAALCAGESSPTPIPASLAIADGAILSKHWDASIYGAVWNDPGLAWVRQQWSQLKTGLKTTPGIDLDAVLAETTGVRGEFLGMTEAPNPKPKLRLQADLGKQAKGLFNLLAKTGPVVPTTVPGADEAFRLDGDGPILARHGSRLVFAFNCDAAPWKITPLPVDGRLVVDYGNLMHLMAGLTRHGTPQAQDADRLLRDLKPWLGLLSWDVTIVPQGLHEVMLYDKAAFGATPIDRALLDRFPAESLAVAGIGLDLATLWKIAGPTWLDTLDQAMHRGRRLGAEATQKEIDAMLAGLGIAGGLQQLVKDLHGTSALAVTPAAPFPGVSIVLPRSPSLDALVGTGMAALGAQPPAEGESGVLPIPNLPLMISVARDRTHWLVSSDVMVVQAWLTGKPNGFLGSATGKAMLAKAPANAYLLGGMDTAAALRTATPFAFMGLSQIPDLPNEARQAILAGLTRLTRESSPAWIWAAEQGGTTRTEAAGPTGMGVVPIAIVAAIAIPNLLESRVAANEAATGASLKYGIFPAQVQFQAGGYLDQDQDNIGEYGTLAELSGRQKTDKIAAGAIRLVQGPLAQGNTANGYNYRMYLPDAAGGAFSSDNAPRAAAAPAADNQEKFYIVYAWPVSTDTGRRMFALTIDGQLRSQIWDGKEPAWNAALGNGWEDTPTWPVHESRSSRPNRPRRAMPQEMPPAPAPGTDPKNMF